MKMPTLTPALSPRRGSATDTAFTAKPFSALARATDAARHTQIPDAATALPLLGERAGVRADNLRVTFLHPRIATLLTLCCVIGPWALGLGTSASAAQLTSAQTEFFETKVRPVLVENCYKCHSAGAEKIKGGLTLDTRDGWLKGGDSGPVIVPGKPDESVFIKAIRYTDRDLAMPPSDKKLPDNLIADLVQWVRMGAPDPRTEATTAKAMYAADMEKARQHWAYRPVTKASVPVISRSVISKQSDAESWFRTDLLNTDSLITQNPIDAFILAKLAAKNLSPSPRADKVTLLRRATFDLHGLPPGEKEVNDFLDDASPNAFEKVIDRLLASPRYGERWGRHWLDLAKYAETKGRSENGRDMRYLWAWTYRDWVIRSLNEDLPYDQFLLRQLAADKLNLPDSREMAAMGFLTLGNRFGNNQNDIIDDRIDLIGKATMGLTLACARCHDHKFDPVPTKDYYSLHGVFASCREPAEGPPLVEPKESNSYRDFKNQLATRETALENFREKIERELAAEWRGKTAEYLIALHDFKKDSGGVALDVLARKRGLQAGRAHAWNAYLKDRVSRHHTVWTPWSAFAALNDAEFATKGRELAEKFATNADKSKPINPLVAKLFITAPANLAQVAARYESLLVRVAKEWDGQTAAYESRVKTATASGSTPPEAPKGFPEKDLEDIREIVATSKGPIFLNDQVVRNFIEQDNNLRGQQNNLIRAINDTKANHPGSPARAHVLYDVEKPKDSYVMVKGNPGSKGPLVPRQPPEIIAGSARKAFKEGSGRLEFAQIIASKDNPLTARVMANRVWQHHFGEGFVLTPDDFGVRSEPPSHPELLDYLASRFMEDGWSLKKLHKLMMLSATYQQSSDDNPRFAQIDPGNKLFWQMNRRRLDFETMRDTILHIGGRLELEPMGGPSVMLDAEPYPTRRSVYAYIDRTRLPSMFQAFDFVNPDLTTGKRNETVVPQQALFMMNSPLVVEQARNLTLRADFKAQTKGEDRIKLLYKLVYQRDPSEIEAKLALEYIRGEYGVTTAGAGAQAWEYGFGEFDPKANRMEAFVQLTQNGGAWVPRQASPKVGKVSLTAKGGMPGNGIQHGAVRRWTARRDGFISIDGMLSEQPKKADEAVRGWIVSSGSGLIGSYLPQKKQIATKLPRVLVKRGDTIDFVVVGKGQFTWSPTVRFIEGAKPGEVVEWNAEKDFSGMVAEKHMEAWEKFAQVLLETNEMTFVN